MPDGSYSVSDIQDCFKYILKMHTENSDNPPVKIYVNNIKIELNLELKMATVLNF